MVAPGRVHAARASRALSVRRRHRRASSARAAKMRAAKIRPLSPQLAPAYMARARTRAAPARPRASASTCSRSAAASSSASRRRFTFDSGSAAVKPQIRRDAAGDRAHREDAQPDLRRRSRPHRHDRDAAGQPGAVGEARGRGRDLSCRPRRRQGADRLARAWRERRRSTIPDADETQKAANRRVEIRLVAVPPASAARRRSAGAARPTSPSPIPPSTSGRWWQVGWAKMRAPWTTPPPLGSSAPKRSALNRARPIAAAHIAHGSSVTHKVHSSRREVPSVGRGSADRLHLGMGGRVVRAAHRVARFGDDRVAAASRPRRPAPRRRAPPRPRGRARGASAGAAESSCATG